jgi:predicted negative regulator of RcsB-dependent stress response
VSDSPHPDRIRTLLLRGDNLLKNGRSPDKAREAFEEALALAQDPSVDERVRELVERRLEALP